MTTTTREPLQQLTERIADWRSAAVEIDRTRRQVRNIALAGRESRNGYEYSAEALRGAVALYENKPVFLDHGPSAAKPFERSTRDLVGSIVNPRFTEGRICGDIAVLDTEAGRTFLALADAERTPVGMSHVVLARRNRDRSRVEAIEEVVSVDAVMYPATTRTFREQYAGVGAGDVLPYSAADLQQRIAAALPAVLAELGQPDWRPAGLYPGLLILEGSADETTVERRALAWRIEEGEVVLDRQLQTLADDELSESLWLTGGAPDAARLAQERDGLLQELAAARDELSQLRNASQQAANVERLLEQSGLPEFARTEAFQTQLRDASTDAQREALIRDRQEVLRRSSQRMPTSRGRGAEGDDRVSDRALVAAIRGGRRGRSAA